MLQWRRVLIRELGWIAFDVDNPGRMHQHKMKPNPRPIKKSESEALAA